MTGSRAGNTKPSHPKVRRYNLYALLQIACRHCQQQETSLIALILPLNNKSQFFPVLDNPF